MSDPLRERPPGVSEEPALRRAETLLGPLEVRRRLAGSVWVVEASGATYVVKAGPGAPDEAAGLQALGAVVGAPPVPAVVSVEDDLLVEEWIEPGPRTATAEEGLGRSLATLHGSPWATFGGGSSWIGRCRVDPGQHPDAVTFYGSRLLGLAERCELTGALAPVVARLGALLPPAPPALVHGDLWWGNVCFASDGRAWLVDPSAHGGHPEEDLAMLALFGALPARLVAAYDEVRPLAPGWEERMPLWQLLPLLVHTALFGGGYREEVLAIVRRYG